MPASPPDSSSTLFDYKMECSSISASKWGTLYLDRSVLNQLCQLGAQRGNWYDIESQFANRRDLDDVLITRDDVGRRSDDKITPGAKYFNCGRLGL